MSGRMEIAARLPWTKLRALAAEGAVAFLPVGSTEAHGPHLPLAVDVLIAEAVCERAAASLERRSVRFPSIAYSLTDFAAAFAGTITIGADVYRAFLDEVVAGIASHGFKEVVVVNHHVEPAHFKVVHEAARAAAERTGARVVVPDHRRKPTGPLLGEEFMHGGSHAGIYETSLMLAIAPELVDESARRALPDLDVDLPGRIKAGAKTFGEAGGPDAYFGAPAKATREEGERLLDVLARSVVEAIAAPAR